MFIRMSVLVALIGAVTPSAHAQDTAAPTPNAEAPQVVQAPPPAPAPGNASDTGGDEISLSDWNRDDWSLIKPDFSLLELGGYLRLRGDLLKNMDLGNESIWLSEGRYPKINGKPIKRTSDFTSTNMRLRLEPRINVSEGVQVVTTIDVLDNLVMGASPNTGNAGDTVADTQIPPEQSGASLSDSIRIKRAYARVTAMNEQMELKFGRMPNHWGLGMMANSGDCLDCDYGDVVDRVSVSVKMAGHLISAMHDWVSNGALYAPFERGSQPLDAVNWDDVFQYSLQISKLDHPDDISDKTQAGDMVLNYGLWNIFRFQWRGLSDNFYTNAGDDPAKVIDPTTVDTFEERRDANPIYTGNAFLRLYTGDIEFAAEGAVTYGSFRDSFVEPGAKTTIFKFGGVADLRYKLSGEYRGTEARFTAGIASGDSAPGFGALNGSSSQRGVFGPTNQKDLSLNNFQFSPDYHIDLLLFRRLIGTVTDAWFLRPAVAYQFNKQVTGTLAGVYSSALFKRSTPSCYSETGALCRTVSNDKASRALGVEPMASLSYGTESTAIGGAFTGVLQGSLFIPFAGFRNPTLPDGQDGGSIAWTVQARLNVGF